MHHEFSPNDLLLDQTMLCEASRLLEKCPQEDGFIDYISRYMPLENSLDEYDMGIRFWPPSNAERLFNLSMLLDGIALHDHLYTLKAELPPDINALRLRQVLIEKGVVKEIKTTPYLPKIKQEFNNFFDQIQKSGKQESSDKETSEEIEQAIVNFLGYSPSSKLPANRHQYKLKVMVEGLRKDYEGIWPHHGFSNQDISSQPFLAVGKHLLDRVSYFGSGSIISGISYLRTFVYWRISEHATIPLYPSSRRISQIDTFAGHIRLFTAEKIYEVVAQAFKENINLIYEDEVSIPLYFPPSLSIFLDLYRSSHDLSKAVDSFRKEFAGVRSDMRSLEEKRRESKTLKERLEVKHQIDDVLKLLSTHYQLKDDSRLETVLGFAPEVLNPLTNPTDPSKYSEKLLTMPVRWIKDWWKKRPFRHVFDLRKRLYDVSNYEQLASDALDIDFSNTNEHFNFYQFYDEYQSLYEQKK